MNTISTINVPFHGNNLYVVNYNGQPYVPMKPIVEGMGLDWMGQYRKLTQRFSKGIEEMSIPTKGGEQSMICLALRKLAGWLHTISPNKVKAEIRDKVIQYQEECDDVLYEYWTTGEVKAKHKSTVQERNPLKNAVNLLVSKKGIMYPEAYSLVHQKFNVGGIDELTADQIPEAVEYVHKLVMEGEYIPKQEPLPVESELNISKINVNALHSHVLAIQQLYVESIRPSLKALKSNIEVTMTERIITATCLIKSLQHDVNGNAAK